MSEKYLDRVYTARDSDTTRALYDAWAASYDAEIAENGYATPGRCAAALAAHVKDKTAPVLDFGCGTGLSGLALKLAGFATLDGVDLSPEMVAQARAKEIYRKLSVIGPDDPPCKPGDYAAIAAIGVIGLGAAPASAFDRLMGALAPGGRLVLSYNDHTLKDARFVGRLNGWLDSGHARLLFREHGPHLPGKNMNSTVYVIEKK